LTFAFVVVLTVYAVLFTLTLAPAYLAARYIALRWQFERAAIPVLAYVVVALAGYTVFWCHFLRPELGRAVALLWLLSAIFAVPALWRARIPRPELVPVALTFVVGLLYLAVLYLPGSTIGAHQRFFAFRPQDNLIPQLFAEHIFWGANLHDGFLGDWLTSDRPPLQSGIMLLTRLVFPYLGVGLNVAYEIVGIIAQLAWIAATWFLCARAGVPARARSLILAFMIFSGFFLYNTVYTWPKLLSAGFALAALLFALESGPVRLARIVAAGACGALALLSHGSAVLFLVPAFAVAFAARRLASARTFAWAAAAGIVLLLPWIAYVRFVDPPGDRLLKMHLAGVQSVDPRPASSLIASAYASTPASVIAANKLANVRTALGDAPLSGAAVRDETPDPLDRWRVREREHVPAALGVLNVGWLVLPWLWMRRAMDRSSRSFIAALLVVVLASIVFWCAVMWGPATTVTTHSAYTVEMLLFVALALGISFLPRPLPAIVLGAAILELTVTWIVGASADAARTLPGLDPGMASIALAAATLTGALLVADARDAPSPAPEAEG
jgi:hypothetical protein